MCAARCRAVNATPDGDVALADVPPTGRRRVAAERALHGLQQLGMSNRAGSMAVIFGSCRISPASAQAPLRFICCRGDSGAERGVWNAQVADLPGGNGVRHRRCD
jgi:hypothetical protein